MSFKLVLQALNDQLVADTTLLDYVSASRFFIGYKGPIGKDDYAIILEPGVQAEGAKSRSVGPSRQFIEEEYLIDIYAYFQSRDSTTQIIIYCYNRIYSF